LTSPPAPLSKREGECSPIEFTTTLHRCALPSPSERGRG
jgi:hypothetical protein